MATERITSSSNDSCAALVDRTKRTRKSSQRSKTGCITCRIRRVKCDEKRPACQRCAHARRKCEGYPSIFAVTKPWEVVMDPSLGSIIKPSANPRVASNDHALYTFDFFHKQSIGKLSEVFGKELWTEAVPRAALHDPAMWHATIAVGSAHEAHWLKAFGGQDMLPSKAAWTLGQYNRAIRALTQPGNDGKRAPPEVVIAASIMFMAVEMIRGEIGKALAHVKSGMRMFNELRRLTLENPDEMHRILIPLDCLERSLRQVEIHLCELNLGHYSMYPLPTVSMFEKQSLPYEHGMLPVLSHRFRDLEHARMDLGWLWQSFINTIGSCRDANDDETRPHRAELDLERTAQYHQALDDWEQKFEILLYDLKSSERPLKSIDRGLIARLRMYHLLHLHVLDTYDSHDEAIWDRYTDRFERLLEHCRTTASCDQFGDPACDMIRQLAYCGYQLGNGIVATCFHVIWKCRVARVRHNGLELIKRFPRREALWDARMIIAVSEELDVFERGSDPLPEAAARNAEPEEIPTWARVRDISVRFCPINKKCAELIFTRARSQLDSTPVEVTRKINW